MSSMLKRRCATRSEPVNCSPREKGCTGRKSGKKRTFTEFDGEHDDPHPTRDVEYDTWGKTVDMEVEMLRRDVQFLASEMLKQRFEKCAEHLKCIKTAVLDERGHSPNLKAMIHDDSPTRDDRCGTFDQTVEREVGRLQREVQFVAREMLKQRSATCTELMNCSRGGTGSTGRMGRKRTFTEFEREDPPPKTEVESGNWDKTTEMEVEMLRRNVQFLACCHSTAPATIDQEDPMVCFVIGEADRIKAHRSVLAGVSPVFEKMFSVGMLEKETGKVSISDASFSSMKAVVKYCYTADVKFTECVDVEEVVHISHKYEINSLKDRCEIELCNRLRDSMKVTMDLGNALGITEKLLVTAEKYGLDRLRNVCVKELRLRNYIVRENCAMDRRSRKVCVEECNSRSYTGEDGTSPRALAKMMHLSFKFGTEDMQDGIYRTVRNLSDEEGKQVWMAGMQLSFVDGNRLI